MPSAYSIGQVRLRASRPLSSLVLRKHQREGIKFYSHCVGAAWGTRGLRRPLPSTAQGLPHQLRGVDESKKEEPGFGLPVYEFSLFCPAFFFFFPAFYLKVTCWVSVASWDHNNPVYAVFKIIVYNFFNSPWRWRVYRPSSFKRTIIKQRFPCKWLVSKWDSFHHTALTPYCSHTRFCWEPLPSLFGELPPLRSVGLRTFILIV